MKRRHDQDLQTNAPILSVLQTAFGARLTLSELEDLAQAILPFLQRTRSALCDELIIRVAANYLRDGARVTALRSGSTAPEWQAVLMQVIAFAAKQRKYPTDQEATSWPDLDAFADIQRELEQYNFEGSFDSWVTVIVARRLSRYWRDQQALRAGGAGFQTRAAREAAEATGSQRIGPRSATVSLDRPDAAGGWAVEEIVSDQPLVAETVESVELQRLVRERVQSYALDKNDPSLVLLWNMVVERQYKLHEAAAAAGLSVSQVHRRIEQLRTYLQQDSRLKQWFESLA